MNYACDHAPLPLCEGERIKVRGSSPSGISHLNPHPTLSLAKGEADDITRSCAEAA
jgi:hypothetical protein